MSTNTVQFDTNNRIKAHRHSERQPGPELRQMWERGNILHVPRLRKGREIFLRLQSKVVSALRTKTFEAQGTKTQTVEQHHPAAKTPSVDNAEFRGVNREKNQRVSAGPPETPPPQAV